MANPDKIRQLADTARHLTALAESPSYPVLKEIVEGKIESQTRRFIGTPDLTQQQLDYYRGVLFGMRVVLDTIEGGEKVFQRAMQQARLSEEEQ